MQTRHIIHIASPNSSKLGSVIMLELANEDEAMRVAQKLAREIGRRVTVRDAKFSVIETIPAARIQ